MTGRLAPLALAAAALVAVACGGAEVAGPPAALVPDGAETILSQRATKDEQYRTDPESAIHPDDRAGFLGLSYYEFDPSWQFVVRLERYEEPEPLTLITTTGKPRPAVRLGFVTFEREGSSHRLEVYSLRDQGAEHWNAPFLPFMDGTTGGETYGAGRYVELAKGVDDWYVLDFNQAYNPLCAYGREIYRCPSTPAENRLSVPVQAGEKGFRHGDAPETPAESAEGSQPA